MNLTLTGVDEWADYNYLGILNEYCEFGFLFSMGNRERRYASLGTILWMMTRSGIKRASLHVCGKQARELLKTGRIRYLLDGHFQRIQVNGALERAYVEEVCGVYPEYTVITQHRPGNEGLLEVEAPNHAVLVDRSGGTGTLPAEWVAPETLKPVGFAGGLTPSNLVGQLTEIAKVAKAGAWVDMESGLRNGDDKFDVALAYEAIRAVNEFTGGA